MVTTIEHDEAHSRFTIHVEGEQAGVAEYERDGDRWVFTHTVVQPEFSGQGLAGKLVGHALDRVIADGGTIVPVCSYVAGYVRKNPQYQEYTEPPQSDRKSTRLNSSHVA